MTRCRGFVVGVLCGLMGLIAGVLAAPRQQMIVVPLAQAKFVAIDPARPQGAQMAVLWGDPQAGPSAMLLRIGKGAGRVHVHSSDYHLVVLEGTMKHWGTGDSAAEAQPLSLGGYWFQPGNEAHTDECLTDQCLMFVQWAGKRDARLAEPAVN